MRQPWIPRDMCVAPPLPRQPRKPPITPHHALLINPFYPKDPHASFGKHVLTPSLALTSIAASTPSNWSVEYWDENLLQGPPPSEHFPRVVGITVHLTFARRAYELAAWYRERGAVVILGFESLENRNIADAHKKSPSTSDYARRVQIFHDVGIQVNGSFVLGFDHDGPDVFQRTVDWVESQRLECATFHILTPYPGTPLFQQMESEGRILHRNWEEYDTAHVVFQPRRMTVEELADGYKWCYQQLFSHASIWRRRPADWRAVASYLAMCYLYKRSNRIWHQLIRYRLTARVWRVLVEATRRRHLVFRKQLAERLGPDFDSRAPLLLGITRQERCSGH